jgi:hypothetical protein
VGVPLAPREPDATVMRTGPVAYSGTGIEIVNGPPSPFDTVPWVRSITARSLFTAVFSSSP